jgi:hypothetical protein
MNKTKLILFFATHSTIIDAHTYIHTLITQAHTLPLRAPSGNCIQETVPTGIEIDEVTTSTTMSSGTPHPTEEYSSIFETPKR